MIDDLDNINTIIITMENVKKKQFKKKFLIMKI